MTNYKFLTLFFLIIAFISCKQHKSLEVKNEKAIDYTSYLLSHSDSVPTIEIKFDQPDSLFFEELNSKLLPEGCETFKNFNIKVDSLTLASQLAQPCGQLPYCGIKMNVQIVINQDNFILVDQEIVNNLSDLHIKFDEVLKNKKEYAYKNRTCISIVRDKKANPELSKLILNSIVNSYSTYMDSIALKHYHKPLEKLSLEQLDELKKERILMLEYWNYPKPRMPEMEALEKLVSDLEKEN